MDIVEGHAEPAKSGRTKVSDFRLLLAVLFTVILAIGFWSSSRYPALDEKAEMGADTPLSGLSFDIVLEILPQDGLAWQLWANTVNWIFTNIQGMSFGVLFGAAALTLLSLIQKRSFENGFANSALGVIIGAPLGVCVNCAAPIALGLHAGRMRLETTLSALLASPTLNIIVVTMSFALLPFQIAVVKLVLSLAMVLIAVPLICRYFLADEAVATHAARAASVAQVQKKGLTGWITDKLSPGEPVVGTFNIGQSAIWFVRNYARNFFFIFIITVPMMFLAAFLGATLAEFFRPSALFAILPHDPFIMIFISMALVALAASFVPAPIALDVILVSILLGLGLQSHFATAILIALGSFSIYAFIILWKAISLRTGLILWATVIGFSMAGGVLAKLSETPMIAYQVSGFKSILADSKPVIWPSAPELPAAQSLSALKPAIKAQRISPVSVPASISGDGGAVTVQALKISAPKTSANNDAPNFTRLIGRELGLLDQGVITVKSRVVSTSFQGGIAAGDIHGDGWPDLIFRRSVATTGLSVYANIGGRFERQAVNFGPLEDMVILNVALADIDGDEALDMIVATDHQNGNYLFYNQDGGFDWGNSVKLPNEKGGITRTLGFADLDRDGDLDIVQGNNASMSTSAGLNRWQSDKAHNVVAWNKGGRQFSSQRISFQSGQTLGVLISDIDRNGALDVLTADDVAPTDEIAFFDKAGQFEQRSPDRQPFPYKMFTSMGYDEGDWNNDLIPDYYGVQISKTRKRNSTPKKSEALKSLCNQIRIDSDWDARKFKWCESELQAQVAIGGAYQAGIHAGCDGAANQTIRTQCAARALLNHYQFIRTADGDKQLRDQCRGDLNKQPFYQNLCNNLTEPYTKKPRPEALQKQLGPSIRGRNILLTGAASGKFSDLAKQQNVARPGWSWDGKFGDLDQDGWQDLMVMTGYWGQPDKTHSNVFYRNEGGQFHDRTNAFGLTDLEPSYSHVRFDYDRDGDIDVIRGLSGPNMIVHRNDRAAGPALWVHLRDGRGNSMAVGATVTICVDGVKEITPGKCQMRPIKASGGFASSDPIAAHFGLGKARDISLISVQWPDGSRSLIKPAALSGGEIIIRRS